MVYKIYEGICFNEWQVTILTQGIYELHLRNKEADIVKAHHEKSVFGVSDHVGRRSNFKVVLSYHYLCKFLEFSMTKIKISFYLGRLNKKRRRPAFAEPRLVICVCFNRVSLSSSSSGKTTNPLQSKMFYKNT